MLMTYQELLQTDNWRQKRQEILLRDDHKCQRCGVSKNNSDLDSKLLFMGKGGDLIDKSFDFCFFENPNSNVSLVSIKYANKVEMICKTDIYKSTINKNHTYVIVENFVEKDFIKYPFNGTTEPQIKDNIFLKNDTNESLITYIRDKVIKDERIDVDLEGFFLIEYGIEHYVSKNKFSLHVHHKCYRKDVDIWAQDNDDYITLCNICHMIVHYNQLIPFYDKNNNILQYLNRCPKCNGTGFLKQYSYHMNGVCFTCHGFGHMPSDL